MKKTVVSGLRRARRAAIVDSPASSDRVLQTRKNELLGIYCTPRGALASSCTKFSCHSSLSGRRRSVNVSCVSWCGHELFAKDSGETAAHTSTPFKNLHTHTHCSHTHAHAHTHRSHNGSHDRNRHMATGKARQGKASGKPRLCWAAVLHAPRHQDLRFRRRHPRQRPRPTHAADRQSRHPPYLRTLR